MKLSYHPELGYVITNLGAVINASFKLNDLLTEYLEDEEDMFSEAEDDDYDAELEHLFKDPRQVN